MIPNENVQCTEQTHEDWEIKNALILLDQMEKLNDDLFANKKEIGLIIIKLREKLNNLIDYENKN